jgi:hypothetical protein
MIRRQTSQAELGLDSLTDTMTNMMGLIVLMLAVSAVVSSGMKITLLSQLTDPGVRRPIYLACRNRQVLFVHEGDQWQRALEQVCTDLEEVLGRKPTTSEALLEANRVGRSQSPDYDTMFVRELGRERGQQVYVIGVRFLPRASPSGSESPAAANGAHAPVTFSPAAEQAIASGDPENDYIDAFVFEDDFDTLRALQLKIKDRELKLGWRPMNRHQNPGLSETGVRGSVGAEQ